ncbi:MAG: hypothetical protein GXP45_01065 [bacterium]|nr:hypothetical protein [bacterium]
MVKAEEETFNAMGEEAANPAFQTGIYLVSVSDTKERLKDNVNIVVSAFNVFGDKYANELDNPEEKADIF